MLKDIDSHVQHSKTNDCLSLNFQWFSLLPHTYVFCSIEVALSVVHLTRERALELNLNTPLYTYANY